MKVSESWLREWVNPNISLEQLCSQLTFSGLEVEAITQVAEQFTDVVVGKILEVTPHPEAERLNICSVDVGAAAPLEIVCGAKNVKSGMKVPAALIGAKLPHHKHIEKTQIRGITSHGMLCSIAEIGLAEQSEGLMQLPRNAPVGESIWDYLKLNDRVIDVSITPNRGDCLSVLGLAKEISAVTHCSVHIPNLQDVSPKSSQTLPVRIAATAECPHYVGRVITNIQADHVTPMWMQERLRRSGLRCISPVVDVMNYVMIELGQPMHAFDLDSLSGAIEVRLANKNETLKLLTGDTIQLDEQSLVIADNKQPLALAGIMGGLDSSVTLLTRNIFLESAYFKPQAISRSTQHYHLASDSAYRFERGVDPSLQRKAIERATELLLEIVGGEAGPLIEVIDQIYLPKPIQLNLRTKRLERILGLNIPAEEVEKIFSYLTFSFESTAEGWLVTIPLRRTDITLEIDLIEEIIRLYGFDKLPLRDSMAALMMHPRSETVRSEITFKEILRSQGFHEVITYSFIDQKIQKLFDPSNTPKQLLNPMTAEMSVMRTTLWPGLVSTLLYNLNRQQTRLRLFEVGLKFVPEDQKIKQEKVLSGLITGSAFPEQWGIPNRAVDFFDLKGVIENLINSSDLMERVNFKPFDHPALHPGQTAQIWVNDVCLGLIGSLHPQLLQTLDVPNKVFLFELTVDKLEKSVLPRFAEVSKFPEIRRDLAILVDTSIPAGLIQDTIKEVAGELLRSVNVFDVYQGKGISSNQKSVALSLVLQHATRTLRDEEITDVMEQIVVMLKDQFAAVLR